MEAAARRMDSAPTIAAKTPDPLTASTHTRVHTLPFGTRIENPPALELELDIDEDLAMLPLITESSAITKATALGLPSPAAPPPLPVIEEAADTRDLFFDENEAEDDEATRVFSPAMQRVQEEALRAGREVAAKRLAKEATDKADAERVAKDAAEKAEAERVAKESADKAQAERIAKESADKAQAERVAEEKAKEERRLAEVEEWRLLEEEAQRIEAEQEAEEKAERLAKEIAATAEAERLVKEAAEKAEAERLVKEIAAKAEAEAERLVKEAAEKAEAERLAKEAAEKAEAERLAREIAAKAEAEAERLVKEAAEKAEAERLVKEAAEKAEAEKLAKEAAEKAEAEKLAKEAAEKADAEKLAKEAAEKAEEERLAAEREDGERLSLELRVAEALAEGKKVPRVEGPPVSARQPRDETREEDASLLTIEDDELAPISGQVESQRQATVQVPAHAVLDALSGWEDEALDVPAEVRVAASAVKTEALPRVDAPRATTESVAPAELRIAIAVAPLAVGASAGVRVVAEIVLRPADSADIADFFGAVRAERPVSFGALLDASLSLGD
ncbi:MAG: hypothetical protein ABI193_25385 [Minicystis sp.]